MIKSKLRIFSWKNKLSTVKTKVDYVYFAKMLFLKCTQCLEWQWNTHYDLERKYNEPEYSLMAADNLKYIVDPRTVIVKSILFYATNQYFY